MYHDVPWIGRPLVTSEDKSDVVLTGNIELVFYYYSVARMQSQINSLFLPLISQYNAQRAGIF